MSKAIEIFEKLGFKRTTYDVADYPEVWEKFDKKEYIIISVFRDFKPMVDINIKVNVDELKVIILTAEMRKDEINNKFKKRVILYE